MVVMTILDYIPPLGFVIGTVLLFLLLNRKNQS